MVSFSENSQTRVNLSFFYFIFVVRFYPFSITWFVRESRQQTIFCVIETQSTGNFPKVCYPKTLGSLLNMNTIQALGIESFLNVLEQLVSSGEWTAVYESKRIRLQKKGLIEVWTPLTAVVYRLINVRIGQTQDDRFSVSECFQTTTDQVSRIVDAEDGQNGYAGYDHLLREKIEKLVAKCAQPCV